MRWNGRRARTRSGATSQAAGRNVEGERADDDAPLEDVRVVGVDVGEAEGVRDGGDGRETDRRAPHRADASRERRSAHDDDRDDVEDDVRVDVRLGRVELRGGDYAGES